MLTVRARWDDVAGRLGSRLAIVTGPALLLVAASVPAARPVAALALAAGWLALRGAGRPEAIAWAAMLPVAVVFSWPWFLGSDVALGETACVAPLSAIVVRRVTGVLVVLLVLGMLAVTQGSTALELGLRRPTGIELLLGGGGLVVLALGGLFLGSAVARPFFGDLDYQVSPAALLPAVLFGVANGVMEEVAYRGAMQAWLARVAPPWIALLFQALVFGIAHTGPDVVAFVPVEVALLGAVGIAGGLVRRQTGSLAIPIGIHVGADIALYVGLACRAAG